MNGKVFIVQESFGKDTESLQKFGRLVTLLRADATKGGQYRKVADELEEKLQHFNSHQDYIVPSGDPVAVALAIGVLMDLTGGTFCLLRWSSKRQSYVKNEVVFDE